MITFEVSVKLNRRPSVYTEITIDDMEDVKTVVYLLLNTLNGSPGVRLSEKEKIEVSSMMGKLNKTI